MDQDRNKLRLDFPFENQRNDELSNPRNYPTTPSTFPQPIHPTPQQHDHPASQHLSNQQNGGYFMNNPYPLQPQQQQQQQPPPPQPPHPQQQNTRAISAHQDSPATSNLQSPQATYQGNRTYNDATNGMIQQFSNQDLGSARFPQSRTASPANSRPRTAGDARQQYANHLAPSMPPRNLRSEDEERPNPNRYSENILKRGTAAKQLVNNFFQENIERARDRNTRAKDLDAALADQNLAGAEKQQQLNELAQKEARFLRFIRTKESPNNFTTLKVIGKGAFGEVKLVQRKTDGKIYALKSLIKTEMFKKDQLAHVRAERDILADSKDNPWLVKLHASFQDSAFLYMLMEFLPGGDLMTMLIKYEIFSEDITRFYMAEIVMAIEAVHKLGFLHR